ncbi:MAG: hypothetical protein RL750_1020, partial [Bacteroidota bacterium]
QLLGFSVKLTADRDGLIQVAKVVIQYALNRTAIVRKDQFNQIIVLTAL